MEGIFEWMLESSLLVVMVFGIRKVFIGRIRYAAIYALWLIVLLRFIIPVNFIPAPVNIGNVFSEAILSGISADSREYDSDAASLIARGDITDESSGLVAGAYFGGIISEKSSTNTIEPVVSGSRRGRIAERFIICCSAIISAVLFVWIVMSNICMGRKINRRRIFFGRRKGINIYTVAGINNPCLYGLLRPAIYIPEAFVSDGQAGTHKVCENELEQIITHEYVHYLHKDHIWAVFRVLLISIYWFHPFLWAAVICSKKDAELFCDETVVEMIGEEKRFCYGEMLIRLAQDARWADFRYSMTSMSRRGKEMEHRILAISRKRRYSGWLMIPLVFAMVLTLGVTCSTGGMETKVGDIYSQSDTQRGTGEPQGIIYNNSLNTDSPHLQDTSMDGNDGSGQPESKMTGLQEDEESITIDAAIFSADYEQAFSNYIDVFTEAVNMGNTDRLHYVLAADSEVYEQQCSIAKNYYKRGIKEEVKSYAIISFNIIDSNQVEINSKEKIKVDYADATSKLVDQEYKYTCENIDGSWIITKMSDIDNSSDDKA